MMMMMMMMMLITLPLCRRSRRLERSYHTNYQRLVWGDGDDAVMERGEEVEEEVVVMKERKEIDYSPMLENARLKVKWFAIQMTFDIQLLHYFLGNVSVLLVDDDDGDILPAVFICWCHVRRFHCQMRRKTASVPHGSTGRAVADSPRPRDDDDDDDDAAAAVRWGHALECSRISYMYLPRVII